MRLGALMEVSALDKKDTLSTEIEGKKRKNRTKGIDGFFVEENIFLHIYVKNTQLCE